MNRKAVGSSGAGMRPTPRAPKAPSTTSIFWALKDWPAGGKLTQGSPGVVTELVPASV